MAVVFVTRFDGEKTVNEGICLRCAKELGIKPVENMIEKMGLSDEDLDRMDTEMEELISNSGEEHSLVDTEKVQVEHFGIDESGR